MKHTSKCAVAASVAAALAASVPAAQIESLVAQGDVLPGIGTVTGVGEVVVNDAGEWAALVLADQLPLNQHALVKNGAVLIKAGDPLPGAAAGATFDYASALGIDDVGDVWWLETATFAGSSHTAVYRELERLLGAGDPVVAAGITPGTTYMRFADLEIDGSGGAFVTALMDDSAIAGIIDDVLLRVEPQLGGGVLTTVVVKRGDVLPGQTTPVQNLVEAQHSIDGNSAGEAIYLPTMSAGVEAVYLDQTLLAEEGGYTPVFGTVWQSFANTSVALNDQGDYAFAGRFHRTVVTDHDRLEREQAGLHRRHPPGDRALRHRRPPGRSSVHVAPAADGRGTHRLVRILGPARSGPRRGALHRPGPGRPGGRDARRRRAHHRSRWSRQPRTRPADLRRQSERRIPGVPGLARGRP